MEMDVGGDVLQFVRVAGIIPALLSLLITAIAVSFISNAADQLGDRFTERRLTVHQATTMLRFFVWFSGILIAVLFAFNLSKEAWLAVGGTIAVSVGFAMKDLTASLVAGIIILFDRPFQVGDRVSFAGYYGEISRIGLRSVRLVTLDDNQITIPSNKFLTEAVSSGNSGALDMLVQIDFFIGIDQDLNEARTVVRDALITSRYSYIDKPWTIVVSQVVHQNYFAIRLRAKVYVLDVKYEKALETDVTERALAGFRDRGVLPPAVLHRDIGRRSSPHTLQPVEAAE